MAICCSLLAITTTALLLMQFLLEYRDDIPYSLMKDNYRANFYGMLRGQEFYQRQIVDLNPHIRPQSSEQKIVSCYYNTPSTYAARELLPANIHPHLCTHINVAFARVENKQIQMDEIQYRALRDIVKLKKVNPNLKILVSVGGAGNEGGFSEMVINHASRKVFIRSIKYLLRNYTLDGIDLDWEFPVLNGGSDHSGGRRERQHFSQLLREIRNEYIREKRNYLLTIAVAAPETIVDISYDVDQINLYTDFVNIMTYDFHSYTKYTPFTGLNSPLYAKPEEQLYIATLNINYTVHLYLSKGLDKSKIVVGIPTYGHSFTLVNPGNSRIGSPASGFGTLGSMGFVNYADICEFFKSHNNIVTVEDSIARVPYLHWQWEWVSFDSPKSVAAKADYIKRLGLGGAMIYSLNADDYSGLCNTRGTQVKFPLLWSINNSLFGNDSSTAASSNTNGKVNERL